MSLSWPYHTIERAKGVRLGDVHCALTLLAGSASVTSETFAPVLQKDHMFHICLILHCNHRQQDENENESEAGKWGWTERERAREREREREIDWEGGLHASFRVGHRAVTAITKKTTCNIHKAGCKKTPAATHNFSSTAGRRFWFWAPQRHEQTSQVIFFLSQSQCVSVAITCSDEASVGHFNMDNYTWEEASVIHSL